MIDGESVDDLEMQAAELEDSLGGAAAMAGVFNTEMTRVKTAFADVGQDVQGLERGISKGLSSAIRGAVVNGDSLSMSLEKVGNAMINNAFNSAVRPVTNHVGGLISEGIGGLVGNLLPFANGGSFSQGRVRPFADGGVVSGPMHFPMRGGETGLMGEAGPEAIMPLSRGSDGKLGVRSAGGGAPVNVTMNINTPDADSFRRSKGQIAAQLGRAIGRGNRNR
ncbi:phage tail tape measure protein [Roseovarius sp. EL26]|uniref:phage tail tape measure protein n=1 Tax=Roseovarius sp. EL26 TaxID=2126672 RepID=UPI000EA19CAC|nr:phage tail tape measure protein [Roseovarius sp. EL26]